MFDNMVLVEGSLVNIILMAKLCNWGTITEWPLDNLILLCYKRP